MKKLPLGKSDFKDIIQNNFVYVDKTKYIYDLIESGDIYFLSRPRRFGKSLTVSTLYYLFKGEKELFKDTWIYDKWNWEKWPVLKIDMS
ncbi:MAG TPA: AAA family ATPase, partial [Thermotogaceae bacterium]|nr:AAA family ATPase [Thermotogaceae bacterium]